MQENKWIEITSQNHGFAVDPDSLDAASIEITHENWNDHTNEGSAIVHCRSFLFNIIWKLHPVRTTAIISLPISWN
jgi:carbamoylphosphate synthase small subunit